MGRIAKSPLIWAAAPASASNALANGPTALFNVGFSGRRWHLGLWTGLLFLMSILALAADCPLSAWCVHGHCPAALRKLFQLSEPFGHGIGVLMIALLIFQLDPLRRWGLPRVLLMSLGAGVLADAVKLLVARIRPRHLEFGGSVWDVFTGWLPLVSAGSKGQSFPSGHAATAVGLAFALAALYPRGRWLFAALATLVACQRLEEGSHYLSDVLFGAAVGSLVATICLCYRPVARLFDRREALWRTMPSSGR